MLSRCCPYNLGVMTETLAYLQSLYAAEWLLIATAALILIDYFFPTDWPAHLGYVCLAVASFFFVWGSGIGPWDLPPSAGLAVGVWVVLAVLHRLLFHRFLTNAEGTEGYDEQFGEQEQETVAETAGE